MEHSHEGEHNKEQEKTETTCIHRKTCGSRAGPITDDETQEAELDPRDKE